jgi:hypothetical protein
MFFIWIQTLSKPKCVCLSSNAQTMSSMVHVKRAEEVAYREMCVVLLHRMPILAKESPKIDLVMNSFITRTNVVITVITIERSSDAKTGPK